MCGPRNDYDNRPYGWGVCEVCHEDCEDETDYDPARRVSMHQSCRARMERLQQELIASEVFARR